MKYHSTRGGVRDQSFEDALLTGYAMDKGLLVPDTIPSLEPAEIRQLGALTYPQLVQHLMRMYISQEEIPDKDLNDLVSRAYKHFTIPELLRVQPLKGKLNILELFHGPTLAFKDLALSVVGQLMEYFLNKRKQHVTVIIGTSGDTGGAAIHSVRGLQWLDMVVLLPKGRCTNIQERQMTTVMDDNVHVYRVHGTSDELDVPVKECLTDEEFTRTHKMCSINSINWCRILVQIAHYFYGYLKACPAADQVVEMVVPTGACGNITSGCYARQMGLPIKFVCAVNTNDIVSRALKKGDFSTSDTTDPTLASAMDIQVPYNVERLVYLYCDRDTAQVASIMQEFEKDMKVQLPEHILKKIWSEIETHVVTDEQILETMKRCWDENNYIVCPHTAVAVHRHYNSTPGTWKQVCVATASPIKFPECVKTAGLEMDTPPEIVKLLEAPTRYTDMTRDQDWLDLLKKKVDDIEKKARAS